MLMIRPGRFFSLPIPDDVQQVNLTQDGPNYFNGPVSEIDTGMALLFWIGLTPDQLPTEPFNPTALGLLTVQ